MIFIRVNNDIFREKCILLGFPGDSVVKNHPAKQETWFPPLDRKDPLEVEIATHSSILAREIPWAEELGGLQSMELQRARYDWATEHVCHIIEYNYIYIYVLIKYVYNLIIDCNGKININRLIIIINLKIVMLIFMAINGWKQIAFIKWTIIFSFLVLHYIINYNI